MADEAPLPIPAASVAAPEVPSPAPDAGVTSPVVAEAAPAPSIPEAASDSVLSAAAEPMVKPEEIKPEEPKAEDVKPIEAAPVVPLTYEPFVLPEGTQVNEAEMKAYTDVFGKHQIPREAVQELINLHLAKTAELTQRQATMQREVWNNTRRGWVDEFTKDPEIGGNRRETTLQQAGGAIERFGGNAAQQKALRDALTLTGAGDNPHVIRLLSNLGKALGEGRMVAATQSKAPQGKSTSKNRYANSPTNGA